MKGLLYKEICMFKSQFKSWVFAFAVMGVYAAALKSVSMIFMMIAMFGFLSCLNTFSYDKAYRCDEYIVAMPVSRRKIVLSKYLFLFLMDLSVMAAAVLVVLIFGGLFHMGISELFPIAMGVLGVTVLLQALVIPVIYKWGPEKARIIMVLIGVTPCLLLVLNRDRIPSIDGAMALRFLYALPLFLAVLLVLSFLLSVTVYRKKDF